MPIWSLWCLIAFLVPYLHSQPCNIALTPVPNIQYYLFALYNTDTLTGIPQSSSNVWGITWTFNQLLRDFIDVDVQYYRLNQPNSIYNQTAAIRTLKAQKPQYIYELLPEKTSYCVIAEKSIDGISILILAGPADGSNIALMFLADTNPSSLSVATTQILKGSFTALLTVYNYPSPTVNIVWPYGL